MTDHLTLQAQLDAANEQIRAQQAEIEALWRNRLDDPQGAGNIGDMPHEPCNEVQQLAGDLREVRGESHGTSVSLATIAGKLDMLLWAIGGVGAVMLGALSWMFLRVDSHETRITRCCIDAHRLEAFENRLSETVAQLRSAQPSTVAKSP